MKVVYILLLIGSFLFVCCSIRAEYNVSINVLNHKSLLNHFWESTGLCPPLPHSNAYKFLLSSDMKQNILLISSVPHKGIKQIRIHWLLELIKKDGFFYNFGHLDQLLVFLNSLKLKPGFEIMGNPSNYFTNFDLTSQFMEFKDLVNTLAKRYISMFGLQYVKSWNFESWNEPDHQDFDNITMTVEGFLKYFDACFEGLKSASSSLIFGGPGASCRKKSFSKRCWALFDHVTAGVSFITGKKVSLDYISFHKKGMGNASIIIENELETIAEIHQNYPNLSSIPIFNDEADPLVGWSNPQEWRADVTYAALIAKIISQHQNEIISNKSRSSIKYTLLSNDNAFLSYSPHYFTQRTLNARFQVNNTNPTYVHFVKKPSLVVMGLLSKLGNKQIAQLKINQFIGGISSVCDSCSSFELSTLLYNSADSAPLTGQSLIDLHYYNFPNQTTFINEARAVSCSLNNHDTNPYRVWRNMGSPDYPLPIQFDLMHRNEGPLCSDPSPLAFDSQGQVTARLLLDLPGVALHVVCLKPSLAPGKPNNLRALNITTGQVLLTWDDAYVMTRCIKTFIIELATSGSFRPINNYKVIFNSFTYISEAPVVGDFRVYAIDFWGQKGAFSDTVSIV